MNGDTCKAAAVSLSKAVASGSDKVSFVALASHI